MVLRTVVARFLAADPMAEEASPSTSDASYCFDLFRKKSDLAPSAGSESPPNIQLDTVTDEMYRSIHEQHIDPTSVIATRSYGGVRVTYV